jgi:L-threonylcarbamoyladenylate synthase
MDKKYAEILKRGGVGVFPTDTIYGIIASVFSETGVDKIYKIKGRNASKGLIILISSMEDLEKFGVEVSEKAKIFLQKFWPGKISVILPFNNNKLKYLNRIDGTLAFRFPDNKKLLKLIKISGPIVAPSANPEGMFPAKNIKEAKKYFDKNVDFYVDGGELVSEPSTIVKIIGEQIFVIRKGSADIQI